MFFGSDVDILTRREAAAAKAICATCPVTLDCLIASFRMGETHGVWGGLTARERLMYLRSHRNWEDALDSAIVRIEKKAKESST